MATHLRGRSWLDRFGTLASAVCAGHCLTLAAAPALLPLLGLGFLHHEAFEWLFLLSAVGAAGAAAWFGHRTHGSWAVTVGFVVGMLALVLARMLEVVGIEGGLVLALGGGVALVASHLLNLRHCRACAGAIG